jgi:hypothetical protein
MLPFLLPAILAGSKILGGAVQGSAAERSNNNSQIRDQNALLAQLYGVRQGATTNALQGQSNEQTQHARLDLDRREHALDAPSTRMGQSVRGSILANAQPFKLEGLPDRIASRMPQISGGLTPEMFSPETRQLGQQMTRKALLDQLRGDEFEPLQKTDFQSGVLAPPKMEDYQKSGLLEKIMAGLATGGALVGGVGEAIERNRPRRVEDPDGYESGGV